jgi:hypothetical protein
MLGSDNQHEVQQALSALIKMDALSAVADVWERHEATQPPKPVAKAFDYTKVEQAVTLYTQDRPKVTMNAVLRAVNEMVPNVPSRDHMVLQYIYGTLRQLGFKASSSGLTWNRI